MNILGYSDRPIEDLEAAVSDRIAGGIAVDISAVETLIG